MNNTAKVGLGLPAPVMKVSEWVQGQTSNLDSMLGCVVLLEVFQVNCPGCFLYALPQAIELHNRYFDKGLRVLGLATAFEDFDKNTLDNLKRLIETGDLVGESLRALTESAQAKNGKWTFEIPFPVAMDKLIKNQQPIDADAVEEYMRQHLPNLSVESDAYRAQVKARVMRYLQQLQYRAQTFELYELQGTPSHILIYRQGVLRAKHFGYFPELENVIQHLLAENIPV